MSVCSVVCKLATEQVLGIQRMEGDTLITSRGDVVLLSERHYR